jgi:hypothetical protein
MFSEEQWKRNVCCLREPAVANSQSVSLVCDLHTRLFRIPRIQMTPPSEPSSRSLKRPRKSNPDPEVDRNAPLDHIFITDGIHKKPGKKVRWLFSELERAFICVPGSSILLRVSSVSRYTHPGRYLTLS